MPIKTETKEQDVKTDEWVQEKCVNTDDGWEHLMDVLVEQNADLTSECESLGKKLAAEENEAKTHIERLEKTRDDKQHQHRVLLEKIESVQVKLDLNSSKITRKNFTAKFEELSGERDQKLETKKRLTQESEELDGRLKRLTEEQKNEKLMWEQEIAALQHEMEKFSNQDEANQTALKDEITALEAQKELSISRIEDWIAEAKRYQSTLSKADTSPQSNRLLLEWEKNVAMVHNSLDELQSMYNKNLKQLHQGHQLDTLPEIPLPNLPHIPMIDLLNFVSYTTLHPHVTQPQVHSAPRPTSSLLSTQNPVSFMPHTLKQNVLINQRFPSTNHATTMPHHTHHLNTLSNSSVPMTPVNIPVSLAESAVGLPQGLVPLASTRTPACQAPQLNPQPVDKLGNLLEKLGTQFPQCTRAQIMGVLQQVKSERGTMSGMSTEDIRQEVERRLMQNERPPSVPPAISRHSHRGPVQPVISTRPSFHAHRDNIFQTRSPQAALSVSKRCLMCQNPVGPGTQYHTSCTHTLHKECISVWLQSSKNNSCPFCPNK